MTRRDSTHQVRRNQRGAVTIEAVMVISMLVIGFAGGVFFHALYAAKLAANRDARLAAWTGALEGCTEKLAGGDSLFDLSGKPPIDEVDTSSPPGFFQVGHIGATVTSAPVKMPDVLVTRGAPDTHTFTSTHQVACNDRLQDEKDGVLEKIGSAIGTLLGGVL